MSMSAENIPRADIQPARHGGIDTELKNLKLLARRLQPILTIHSTELQIFQRLCYKNKNQHRGALFWRNVTEVRRFLERIESLNLCDSINAFRSKFYDTTQSVNSIKGPWTHCPDTNYLADYSEQCRKALRLVEKTAERCLNAHRSFHRSMQAAAFLQLLLMFIAISARTRTLALELHEVIEQIRACTIRLSVITGTIDGGIKGSLGSVSFDSRQAMGLDTIDSPVIPNDNIPISMRLKSPYPKITQSPRSSQLQSTVPPGSHGVVIELTTSNSPNETLKEPEWPRKAAASADLPRKKKRQVRHNEIDDIFGF